MFLRFGDVFTQSILVYSKGEGGPTRCKGNSKVYVARLRTGEEEEVCDAERTCHCGVVLEFVGFSFLRKVNGSCCEVATGLPLACLLYRVP
jgi:hypothetical protein